MSSVEKWKNALDQKLCCGPHLTLGDLFKLAIPLVWTVIVFAAILAYLLGPLGRGDSPRWNTAALLLVSAVAGVGVCVAIYSFHRTTSSTSVQWTNEQRMQRQQKSKMHMITGSLMFLLSLGLLIFFAAFASDMNKCAHETCGADIAWSVIPLLTSILWIFMAWLAMRDLSNDSTPGTDLQSNKGEQEEGAEEESAGIQV